MLHLDFSRFSFMWTLSNSLALIESLEGYFEDGLIKKTLGMKPVLSDKSYMYWYCIYYGILHTHTSIFT